HQVTALSRHGASPAAGASSQRGDVTDQAAVASIASDHDVVVSALGPSREPGDDPAEFTSVIIGLADAVGSARLLVVGGAGSLRSEAGVRLVDLPDFPAPYKAESLAQADALEALRRSRADLDWTYLSPAPEIGPGERTGGYAVGGDEPVGEFISFEDYAVALVDELEHPKHQRARFTVAQPAK
ncbi:MAG: putative epimerase/dehydratase, partial [Pseudonocardiales bacterium]|nr:putative epimerase/dehydratase [Pseudonocardiales bacterium]